MSTLFFQPLVVKLMSLKRAYIITMFLTALCITIPIYFQWLPISVLSVFLAGLVELVAYTCLLAMLSNAVGEKEQGMAMGGTGALYGLAWVLNSLFLGGLDHLNTKMPILVAVIVLVIILLTEKLL